MRSNRLVLIVVLGLIAFISGLVLQIIIQLPDVEILNYYLPSEATVIYSSDDKVLARLHKEENRRVITLSKISKNLQQAIVAIEDERFYSHHGIDFIGISRAFFENILHGRINQGGSTITQQLARNLFLTRRKTLVRKLAEVILALQIEKKFTKPEILEFYLNQIYFGHNAYGVESACQIYFNKHADEINLAEATLLAGIIKGPEIFSPYKNPHLSIMRQKIVLHKLYTLNLITREDLKKAQKNIIKLHPENVKRYGQIAPYFVSFIMNELTKNFGDKTVYEGGLKVYTTLDTEMQEAAEETVDKFLKEEGEKYRFSQTALLAIDPRNGHIKAMVGGADYFESQFNRAVQAKRQPGSSFKPFIYVTALEQKVSPGTIFADRATTFQVFPSRWNPDGNWKPKNFDRKFRGNVTMREALENSLNIPSIKLLQKVGIYNSIKMARRLGIKSHLEPALSLVLGACEVSLLEITSAYGVFANNGTKVEPCWITKILGRDNKVLYEHKKKEEKVLDENTAALMVDIMKGVIRRGTGVRGKIDREAAAKTGTTEEFKDAWFIGFVPQLVTGVWVGNDDNTSMKGIAEVAVCPRIFKSFMLKALKNEPVISFPRPGGVVRARICRSSGLLANHYCPNHKVVTDYFFKKDVPITECYIHPLEDGEIEEDEIPVYIEEVLEE